MWAHGDRICAIGALIVGAPKNDYAVGFKKYVDITAEDILSDNFIGLVKCDIEPPKNLYVPVLPDNSNGKLLFQLNPMKEKLGHLLS